MVRRWARGLDVRRVGIAGRLPAGALPAQVISCGLAGGLDPALRPGQVVIPDELEDHLGARFTCDPRLTDLLRRAARALGWEPVAGRLLTAPRLVRGAQRRALHERGGAAVDMEAALFAAQGLRVAAVKVVLDTPAADLTLTPRLLVLGLAAPLYAGRAGHIAARGALASGG